MHAECIFTIVKRLTENAHFSFLFINETQEYSNLVLNICVLYLHLYLNSTHLMAGFDTSDLLFITNKHYFERYLKLF